MELVGWLNTRPFKRLLNGLFNRLTIFAAVLALQLTLFVVTIVYWAQNAVYFYWSLQILSLLIVIWLARKDDNPSYKLGWTILIMLFPLLGGLFYLVWGNTPLNRTVLRRFNNALFRIDELDRWSHEPAERLAAEQTNCMTWRATRMSLRTSLTTRHRRTRCRSCACTCMRTCLHTATPAQVCLQRSI